MGRRRPQPDHAKLEAFVKLIAEGVPSARAARLVGLSPRTDMGWRNGRKVTSGGTIVGVGPVSSTRRKKRPRNKSTASS